LDCTIENVTVPDGPLDVDTLTVRSPSVAFDPIVKVVTSVVPSNKITGLTEMSAMGSRVFPSGAKLAPVKVTVTAWPGDPLDGVIEVRVGAAVGLIVSVTGISSGEFAA